MCVELAAPSTNTSPPQAARWWCPEMAGTTPRRLSPPSSAWPRPTASARCRTHSPALGHTTCRQMRTCLLCVRTHLPSGASSQRHSARNQPCRPPSLDLVPGQRSQHPCCARLPKPTENAMCLSSYVPAPAQGERMGSRRVTCFPAGVCAVHGHALAVTGVGRCGRPAVDARGVGGHPHPPRRGGLRRLHPDRLAQPGRPARGLWPQVRRRRGAGDRRQRPAWHSARGGCGWRSCSGDR